MTGNDQEEIESARILVRENLFDEAKQTLFRIMTRITDEKNPVLNQARDLLQQIQNTELDELIHRTRIRKRPEKVEDPKEVIQKLESDLNLAESSSLAAPVDHEIWSVEGATDQVSQSIDLAIAFYEMGCFADSLRHLRKAEKKIRIESTFLGEQGVFVIAFQAMNLISMGKAFEAKVKIEPVLMEPDLAHEQKLILYYAMGSIEQALQDESMAKSWFQKISQTDPDYRDVRQRIKVLNRNS